MSSRRPVFSLVAAALFCAALGVSPESSRATPPRTAAAVSPAVVKFGPAGRKLRDQIAVLEADILGHLTGSKPETFTKLKDREQELKVMLAQSQGLTKAERAALTKTLRKHELLLARGEALARKGERLDPRLETVLRNAGASAPEDAFDALDQVTDQLVTAATATDPAEANRVFDNLLARRGTTRKAQNALQAVRLDFAGKKEPIVFTPPSSKGTNDGRRRITTTPPPAKTKKTKAGAPSGSAAVVADVKAAAGAAYRPFVLKLSAGDAADFDTSRAELLEELALLAEMAEIRQGRDPTAFRLDEQIAHLMADESREAQKLGLGAEADLSRLEARLTALGARSPELAAFTAALWNYRFFLQDALARRTVPHRASFKSWELYPQARGYAGIEVEGISYDGVDFVGLSFKRADGTSVFQAYTQDGRRAIKLERKARGAQEIVSQNFDGRGKVLSQTVEKLDAAGRRLQRQSYDPATQDVESTFYDPNGKVLRVEKGNAKTGEGVIRQLGPGPHFEAKLFKDGRREIRFDDEPQAPYQLQVDRVNADGSIELDFRVLKDGRTLKQVSAHVQKVLKGKTPINWDVDVASLPAGPSAARKAAALALAKEILKAIGEEDGSGRKARALADFLNLNAVIGPGMGARGGEPPIRLSISMEARRVFTLVLQNKNGTRTVLTGYFGAATPEPGRAGGPAFLVQNDVDYDADWNMTFPYKDLADRDRAAIEYQKRAAKIAYEYLGDGARIWRKGVESEVVNKFRGDNWNPGNWFANKNEVRHHYFERQSYDASRKTWAKASSWEGKPEIKEKEGSAPALAAAQSIVNMPGVKQVLGASNDVSNFLYTGAANLIESNIPGDLANLNSLATRSRNVAWTRSIAGPEPDGQKDPEKYEAWAKKLLAQLTPGARKILDDRVLELRPERLAQMGLTPAEAPDAYDKAMRTRPSVLEEYFTLPEFGAGTYGKQLARNGHPGWAVVVSAGESLGQMATNPLTWAMPYAFSGLGKFATSMTAKAGVALDAGATGASRALTMLSGAGRMAQGYVAFTVGAPFILDTVHTTLEAIEKFGTPEGSVAAGEAMVDLAFVAAMTKFMRESGGGLRDNGLLRRLTDRFRGRETVAAAPAFEVVPKINAVASPRQLTLDFGGKPATFKAWRRPKNPADLAGGAPEAPPPAPRAWETVTSRVKGAYDGFLVATHLKADAIRGSADVSAKRFDGGEGRGALSGDAPTWKAEHNAPSMASGKETAASPAKTGGETASVAPEAKAPEAGKAPEGDAAGRVEDAKAKGDERGARAEKVAADGVVESPGKAKEGAARDEAAAPKAGEQLEFDFMKDKPEAKTVKLDEVNPEASSRRRLRPEEAAESAGGRDVKVKERAPEKVGREFKEETRAKRFARHVLEGGRSGLAARLVTPPRPPIPHRRPGYGSSEDELHPVKDGDSAPPKEVSDAKTPPSDETSMEKDSEDNDEDEKDSGRSAHDDDSKDSARTNAPSGGGEGAGSSASGGKGEGKEVGEGRHPKAPKPGGFDNGGGSGGAGGGGGGDSAAGDGGRKNGKSEGISGGSSLPDVTPESRGDARPAGFASPSVPARRSDILRNESGVGGGHSPTPSLARRFDGAPERPRNAWTATPMKGVGAGGWPSRMGGGQAPGLKQTAPSAAAPATEATAMREPPAQEATAPAARPEEEDYGYTYLASPRHQYEFPNEKSAGSEDWRYLLSVGLRVSAALAVAYLIYHSDIGYLLGATRRRRQGPGAGPPAA